LDQDVVAGPSAEDVLPRPAVQHLVAGAAGGMNLRPPPRAKDRAVRDHDGVVQRIADHP
jgi:hypothetical protein